MTEDIKNKIIALNTSLCIKTSFINDDINVLGYALDDTIYLNIAVEQDFEKTNKHELMHFITDTEIFKSIMHSIIEKLPDKIKELRSEYKLKYYGLYSKEEIDKGFIDEEIIIDLLVGNLDITLNHASLLESTIFETVSKNIKEKRYLNLNIKSQIQNMNLTHWEKLFVVNYYDGKNHLMPSNNKYEVIRKDIEEELQKLYDLTLDENNFKIDYNSRDVLREYESEIKALKQRGEDTTYLEINKESYLKELANKFSKQLYEEYKHIVDYIKGTNYESSFKVMMLKETLTNTYKKEKKEEKDMTIVKKRKMNETITSHMIINDTVLKTIYDNIKEYNDFGNIYFAGIAIFNEIISKDNEISLNNVETYDKGNWLKFEGKKSNEKEYIENAKKLSALVQNTPWCTKTLASTQLEQGDFYVFVSNDNKPHIAVKMNGNSIDEVRGIANGNDQEIEQEYRDVAISFLHNNKDIKNGKEWLTREEWNKRLVEYNQKIDNGTLEQEEIEQLIKDILVKDYNIYDGRRNINLKVLKTNLDNIKNKIALHYNCSEEEIFISDVNFSELIYRTVPYKAILGNVDFRNSQITDLGNLQSIEGSVLLSGPQITDLGNLQSIGGYANFGYSKITDLSNLQSIGGLADFRNSQIKDFGQLREIKGDVYLPPNLQELYHKEFKDGKRIKYNEELIMDKENKKR